MKRDFKIFITGFIIASILMFSISGFAEGLKKSILVTLNDVKLKVNGKKVEADNFLYNGTTYVPLRAVANMLNKEVTWDGGSKTVGIDDKVIQNPAKDSNTNNQLEIESIKIGSKDVKLYEDINFIVKIINPKKLSDKYYSIEDEVGPCIDIYFQGPNGSKDSVLRYSNKIDAWQGVFQGVSKDDVGTWAISDIMISGNGALDKSIFAALNKSIDISTLKFHVLDGNPQSQVTMAAKNTDFEPLYISDFSITPKNAKVGDSVQISVGIGNMSSSGNEGLEKQVRTIDYGFRDTSGTFIKSGIMFYDKNVNKWIGSFDIKSNDPKGKWIFGSFGVEDVKRNRIFVIHRNDLVDTSSMDITVAN
ncbi:MAG TPA: copper amine oxidase N-terminal domain-containing protein [Clostridia bacterium]